MVTSAGANQVVKLVHGGSGVKSSLRNEFHAIGDRLPEAGEADLGERHTDAVRAYAVLDDRADAALGPNRVGDHREDHQRR